MLEPYPIPENIEASITSTGLPSCLDSSTKYPILVVPDSNYNQTVPVLLGTNILHHLLSSVHSNYGDQYLQRASSTHSMVFSLPHDDIAGEGAPKTA